jgi:hypothetical protein
MHKSATKCNETVGKWCRNKHGASKIIDTFETYHAPITDTLVVDEPLSQEVDLAAKSSKAPWKPVKKVVAVRSSKRVKKSSDADASLEAHQSTSSSDDVHVYTGMLTSTFAC